MLVSVLACYSRYKQYFLFEHLFSLFLEVNNTAGHVHEKAQINAELHH